MEKRCFVWSRLVPSYYTEGASGENGTLLLEVLLFDTMNTIWGFLLALLLACVVGAAAGACTIACGRNAYCGGTECKCRTGAQRGA